MVWQNWSGRHRAADATLLHVRSEADAQARIAESSGPVRICGAGHSHAPLVPTDGTILDLSGLAGVISSDQQSRRAWVGAASRIFSLGRPLHQAGLALINQGDIDQQAICGAVATGTHGTGHTLRNLSAAVTGVRLITADGKALTVNESENTDLWPAIRLHLGAFGVITRLELQCREAYRLRERGWKATFTDLEADIPSLIEEHRHFEFFWYPHNDTAIAKTIDETEDEPEYPLAAEGGRCAWSYEVLPNHRPDKHTEMEYSVPAAQGLACFKAIRELLQTRFTNVRWPVEYRTLAADDVWLSSAYQRDTVTISVHQDVNEDETAYYQACEAIFLAFDGRPHWGKVHYLSGDELARRHPKWQDWWRVRNAVDPEGRFLNDHLRRLRGG